MGMSGFPSRKGKKIALKLTVELYNKVLLIDADLWVCWNTDGTTCKTNFSFNYWVLHPVARNISCK
jgi:hypothetical protein